MMKNKQECSHSKSIKQIVTREFQKETFKFEANVCSDCGATLLTDDLEKEFNQWIETLAKSKRHLFQVQYSLSETALDCISKLSERFPSIDESLLIRCLVMVYFDIVEDSEHIMEMLEEYVDSADFEILKKGNQKSKKVQFKPSGMNDIISYSEVLHTSTSKVVEEAVYRMLLLSIKEDSEMKEFWETIVLRSISTILKAA